MYDQREKARRDYEWAISSARREGFKEGFKEGFIEGFKEGLIKGFKEAFDEGREEGELTERIRLLQELLGEQSQTNSELQTLERDALAQQLALLQQHLRERES